ncbi:MAG: DUF6461 domain-containing protein [Actinomycetota bacterium]|nr:DUF6461 domain-containing protein [Actinomycetota bacterium]
MGIEQFEPVVRAALPDIVAVVPQEPAARLGRWVPKHRWDLGSQVATALHGLGHLLCERLLGALELTVDRLTVDIPPDLVSRLTPSSATSFGTLRQDGDSAVRPAVSLLDQLHPGASDLVVELVDALRHVAEVPDATGDEAEIAARHGAAHLALSVLVSTAVLRSLGSAVAEETPAIVGVALGAAAIVLPRAPKPPGYAAAVLAKRRAEYRLPRSASLAAAVVGNTFWLTEGSAPRDVDVSGNGLVAAVADGVVIRTGVAEGPVRVSMRVLTGPPDEVDPDSWDEVVEISWTAPEGGAFLSGATTGFREERWETPPWPGDYRVRVHAYGRDDEEDSYSLVMWQAPSAPEVVHKKTDRLGHRLRGEPEPPLVIPPYAAYRWIEKHRLHQAVTITVVRGLTATEVIRTFGGDPAAPVPLGTVTREYGYVPAVAVLDVGDVVLAVEDNGFRGADRDVLTALSRNGTAASVFWNVNADFQIAVADHGTLGYAGEPGVHPGVPHAEDLDFEAFRHHRAKALTVLARCTGHDLTPEDLAAIDAADQAFLLKG